MIYRSRDGRGHQGNNRNVRRPGNGGRWRRRGRGGRRRRRPLLGAAAGQQSSYQGGQQQESRQKPQPAKDLSGYSWHSGLEGNAARVLGQGLFRRQRYSGTKIIRRPDLPNPRDYAILPLTKEPSAPGQRAAIPGGEARRRWGRGPAARQPELSYRRLTYGQGKCSL